MAFVDRDIEIVSSSGDIIVWGPTGPIKAVQIGSQLWMAENLNVTNYRDGTPIRTGLTNEEWGNIDTEGSFESQAYYCAYGNSGSYAAVNEQIYGKLYNWNAVMHSASLAPVGWHIPDHNEMHVLINSITGSYGYEYPISVPATNKIGTALKEGPFVHWSGSIGDSGLWGVNDSGFTALPAGLRYSAGNFGAINENLVLWTTDISLYGADHNATAWRMRSTNQAFIWDDLNRLTGASVRCIFGEAESEHGRLGYGEYPPGYTWQIDIL